MILSVIDRNLRCWQSRHFIRGFSQIPRTHSFPHAGAYPDLFDLYHRTLCLLENNALIPVTLRLFEKKLLDALGYGLSLNTVTQSNFPIGDDHYYLFDPDQGFCVAEKNDANQSIFLGADLLAIAEDRLQTEAVLQSAKRLMRLALAAILGEKPLNSRLLF